MLLQREGGLALKRQAVLFRTSHHSAALELELARRNIPYLKFGGLKFLEAAHVKDLLSLLRWSQNPRGQMAGFRVAQLVQGLGPASARGWSRRWHRPPIRPRRCRPSSRRPRAAEPWQGLRDCLQAMRHAPWPAALERALQWYLPQLQRLHEDAAVRRADLEQLTRLARGYRARAKPSWPN